jgi:hypothetical protein
MIGLIPESESFSNKDSSKCKKYKEDKKSEQQEWQKEEHNK